MLNQIFLLLLLTFTTALSLTFIPSTYSSTRKTISSTLSLPLSLLGRFINEASLDSPVVVAFALRWDLLHNGILPSTPPTTYDCTHGNWWLIGGCGIVSSSDTLERAYDNLPSHNFAYFGLTLFTMDDWQPSDCILFQADGQTVATYYPKAYQGVTGNLCGNPSIADTYTDISGKFPHSSSSMTFKLVGQSASSTSATTASFGIFQLTISFPSAVITETADFILSPASVIRYPVQGKTCSPNHYLASDATCQPCAAGCTYCWGPDPQQCYACTGGRSFDGTSCIACPANCRTCSSFIKCDLCNSFYLLDVDGVCKTACSNPGASYKAVGGVGFCLDPCPTGQFMLWNKTCASECPFPLSRSVSPTQGGLCDYPCADGEYLYWNGSCLSSCNSPYKPKVEISLEFVPAVHFCNLPCQLYEYLFEDGSCQLNCPKSMISSTYETTLKLCKTPKLSPEEAKQAQQAADLTQQGGKTASAALKGLNILSPSNPSSTTTGSLAKMFSYLRYLNISHSPRLEAFFQAQDFDTPDSIPFPTLSNEEKGKYPNRPKPYMFEKYGLFSSFLANFGNDIISLSIYLGIMGLIWGLNWSCRFLRNLPILKKSAAKGKVIMQNYVISQFYGASGEIIFYATIELRAVVLDSGHAFLSFFTCLVCLIIGCLFIFIHFWVLYKYQEIKHNHNTSKHALEKYKKKFEGMQLFFEDFKDATFGQQAFLFYSLIRNILFNLTVGLMFAYPLAQTIIIVLLDFLMVIYLGFKRPLKDNLELVQQICFEISILTATGSCMTMAFLDLSEDNYSTIKENSSLIIIYINIVFNFLPLLFLGLKVFVSSWELFHWIRKNYKKFDIDHQITRPKKSFEDSQHTKIQMSHSSDLATIENIQGGGEFDSSLVIFLNETRIPRQNLDALNQRHNKKKKKKTKRSHTDHQIKNLSRNFYFPK